MSKFRIKPYVLTRVNSDSTYYEIMVKKSGHGILAINKVICGHQPGGQQFAYIMELIHLQVEITHNG